MNLKDLEKFIFEGKNIDYSSNDESSFKKEDDGSTTIICENNGFKSCDNFFGGEPYGGREVIFYNGKAIWIMVYYGLISEKSHDKDEIYAVLKMALREGKTQKFFRGPEEFIDGNFTYRAKQVGNISEVCIDEQILFKDKEVYKAKFSGGLVDTN